MAISGNQWKVWSKHAWLHAMQVLMRSGVPAFALFSKNGSARKGRAIETRSASPLVRISSAISGVLMRFVATRGILTPLASWRSFLVTQLRPPRGTQDPQGSSGIIRDHQGSSGLMRGHHLKPPRGTHVAIVGTRASCHPMPVLMMSAPDEGRNQHKISIQSACNQHAQHAAPRATRCPCGYVRTCRLEAL